MESTALRYDARSNKWDAIPDMLRKRSGHELTALDNCIYALGGTTGGTTEKFDVKSQKWTEMPSMSGQRAYFGAVSV